MAVCLVPKLKRYHKLSPTGEWLLFFGMSEDHKTRLLVDPNARKEAEVRSVAFHEDNWLNTWRRERNESVDPTPEQFEKKVENTPPRRDLRELLRSQIAQA